MTIAAKPRFISLIVLALGLFGSASAGKKPRNWQTGKLVDSQRSQSLAGAVDRPGIGDVRRTTNVYETQDTFVIETDSLTYTVTEIARGTKPANVTVNGPVKFAVEGTSLYLLDDGGKEHRTNIAKKVLNPSSEAPK